MLEVRTPTRSPGAARPARRQQDTARRPGQPDALRRQPAALVDELSGASAVATLRLDVLRTLDQFGPQPVTEIPRAWPVTREHIRRAIRRLADDGLLEVQGDGRGSRTVRLTEIGRRVLDEIDWTETVRSMERDGEL